MDNKFTKGEWKIKHSESKDAFNIIGTITGGRYKIARVPYFLTNAFEKINEREKLESEANAKLIACAPEMLEALKEAIRLLYGTTEFEVIESYRKKVDDFEQVIKKATE